ncbi:MAG: hypothetical protein ABIR24_13765 [Verrucomicrobiota bacterium]
MKLNFKTIRLAVVSFTAGFFFCWSILHFSTSQQESKNSQIATVPKLITWNIPRKPITIILPSKNAPRLKTPQLNREIFPQANSSVDLIDTRPQPMVDLNLDN